MIDLLAANFRNAVMDEFLLFFGVRKKRQIFESSMDDFPGCSMLIRYFALAFVLYTVPLIIYALVSAQYLTALSLSFVSVFSLGCIPLVNHAYARIAKTCLVLLVSLLVVILACGFGTGLANTIILPIVIGVALFINKAGKRQLLPAMAWLVALLMISNSTVAVQWFAIDRSALFFRLMELYSWAIVVLAVGLHNRSFFRSFSELSRSKNDEIDLSQLAIALMKLEKLDEIIDYVLENCISKLHLEDCVVYIYDEKKEKLIQSAYLRVNIKSKAKVNLTTELALGEGIVGSAALSKRAICVPDTSLDSRYVEDGKFGLSELSVPLICDGKVIGVIDSEHSQKGYFRKEHIKYFEAIAAIVANKIASKMAEDKLKANEQLTLQAEKTKSQNEFRSKLYADVAHEFRTPLTLILDILSGYEDGAQGKMKKDFETLKRNADTILKLTNQLLDVSKVEKGRFKLHLSTENISELVKSICRGFESSAIKKGVHFNYNIAPSVIGDIDIDIFQKVISNLLSNAIKYTQTGNTIFVKAIKKKEGLMLTVGDSGMGMSQSDLRQIFDRFFVINEDGRIFSGASTGLGLSITKELVELHQGEINVQSLEDCGTLFVVTIPIAEPEEPALISEPSVLPGHLVESHDSRQKETVLLVEDDPEFSSYLGSALKDYEVISADNGLEGERLAVKYLPDVIISDNKLSGLNGIDMVRRLKNNINTASIPVIMMSAVTGADLVSESLDLGVEDFLTKPFRTSELKTKVRNIIKRYKEARQAVNREVLTRTPSDIVFESTDKKFIESLTGLINENMDNSEFSVSDIQEALGLSRMQIHRKVRAIANTSTSEFVRLMRLKRASEMLENECDNVSQIAYAVGFSSLSYFSKAFKDFYGMSPSEYAGRQLEEGSLVI